MKAELGDCPRQMGEIFEVEVSLQPYSTIHSIHFMFFHLLQLIVSKLQFESHLYTKWCSSTFLLSCWLTNKQMCSWAVEIQPALNIPLADEHPPFPNVTLWNTLHLIFFLELYRIQYHAT